MSKEAAKELGKANKAAGQIVVMEARRRAPRGPHEGSGKYTPLSRGINASSSQTTVSVFAGGKRTPYAAAIEFGGTIPRRGFKGLNRRGKRQARALHVGVLTHITARPYLRPAVQAKLADVVIAYERMLDNLTEKLRRA